MENRDQLDKTYHFIQRTFIERGTAPHFTEIASEFGVSPDEGRKLLHDLMSIKSPMWLYPGTDLIASFAPFNNLPTQYLISVDGHQKWFAQGGLEALAVCWVFPDKEVSIDAPCLDCGEKMHIEMKNGLILASDPDDIHGYVDIPFSKWAEDWPYTGSRIHLFRSKEHALNWSEFKSGTEEGILNLSDIVSIMSTPRHSARLNGKYISSSGEYAADFIDNLAKVTRNASFWRR